MLAQVSYMLWGIGMTLSIIVFALYFHRLTVHSLPAAELIVSAFLPLGECLTLLLFCTLHAAQKHEQGMWWAQVPAGRVQPGS